jgi:hypothetical protein
MERSVKCHFPYCYLINYSALQFMRKLLLIDKKSPLHCYTHQRDGDLNNQKWCAAWGESKEKIQERIVWNEALPY